MKLIDNVNETLQEDLKKELNKGTKISIVAASFSIYAFRELAKELGQIEELDHEEQGTFTGQRSEEVSSSFYFSHSALREGWDNPIVFQICTLKQSSSDLRKRQEVGRGLRICVNQDGEDMDVNVLGNDVHNVNALTVIASESYDSFAKGLQTELAEAVADRPKKVTPELFVDRLVFDAQGNEFYDHK